MRGMHTVPHGSAWQAANATSPIFSRTMTKNSHMFSLFWATVESVAAHGQSRVRD